jgi:predicted nucleic acid-binding protein
MIGVDASPSPSSCSRRRSVRVSSADLYRDDDDLHAPHLLDVEVLRAPRRIVRRGEVKVDRAGEAIEDLAVLRIVRHAHADLAARAWDLRENFTMYDALAEALDATVVTCDGPFGSARGHSARIEVIRPA